tara:strand:+ start:289 stop:654 length:366 start_codon:yes stop_codon:yes gene_type:complete
MTLNSIFKTQSVVFFINGLLQVFATEMFFEMANMEITPHLVAVGQFMGVTFVFLAIFTWKLPDIAGNSVEKFGSLWALGCLMWAAIIGYHIAVGVVGGPTAFVNVAIFAIFAIAYFLKSRS